jgi:hypothetical protein
MKEVLIIFPDPQLPYSPTTLNLFYELKKHFKVTLLSAEPAAFYSLQKVDDPEIIYFSYHEDQPIYPGLIKRVVNKVKNKYNPPTSEALQIKSLTTARAKKIIEFVKDFDGEIIAVDFFALWCVQQAGKKAHLISLEILENDIYKKTCNFSFIKSIIIQSSDRYDYLFGEGNYRHFFIQNSPPYIPLAPDYSLRSKYNLIYCGSAMPWFGIVSCLDFIEDFPEYTLTIKGAIPKATQSIFDQVALTANL